MAVRDSAACKLPKSWRLRKFSGLPTAKSLTVMKVGRFTETPPYPSSMVLDQQGKPVVDAESFHAARKRPAHRASQRRSPSISWQSPQRKNIQIRLDHIIASIYDVPASWVQ